MDGWWGAGDWFRDDSRALHLLYALFLLLLHQFHLRSLDIRSQRLGIPAVGRKVCERSWCNGGGTSKLETTGSLPADSDAQLEEDPRASVFRSWLFFTMDLPSEWTWLMFTWTTIISRRSLLPHSILTITGKSLVHLSSPFSPQTGAETHPFHPWIPAPWYLSRHRCISDQSCPTLCNPIDVARQASLSMRFSRQEYWNRWPSPSSWIFPTRGSHPRLCVSCTGRWVFY